MKKTHPMTKCPQCEVTVRVDRLVRHLAKVHDTQSFEEVSNSKATKITQTRSLKKKFTQEKPVIRRWRCHRCNRLYPTRLREEHLKFCNSKPEDKRRGCPYCSCEVLTSQLAEHLKNCLARERQVEASMKRTCPYCHEQLRPEMWRKHADACRRKQQKAAAEDTERKVGAEGSGPLGNYHSTKPIRYYFDESGVLQILPDIQNQYMRGTRFRKNKKRR